MRATINMTLRQGTMGLLRASTQAIYNLYLTTIRLICLLQGFKPVSYVLLRPPSSACISTTHIRQSYDPLEDILSNFPEDSAPQLTIPPETITDNQAVDLPSPSKKPSPPKTAAAAEGEQADDGDDDDEEEEEDEVTDPEPRLPRSVQALYLKPLKRRATWGVPTCDLQLRSYSVRNLEFFADFALRAAYYLKLPVSGPTPLPRIVERWTVPRSNFAHKKSQENFERITLRRLIQIQDGHADVVDAWLAYLRKYQFYGVGMKANVWAHEPLDVAGRLDRSAEMVGKGLERKWRLFGQRVEGGENVVGLGGGGGT
ncbi:MAG: mitochondrial 37S ribosomal protein rsm10 [Peltula sp. TS41687]|nr:MAG: mitochondrial 37S ribosomal protein rsm10 [Peltula sp. TS41687]